MVFTRCGVCGPPSQAQKLAGFAPQRHNPAGERRASPAFYEESDSDSDDEEEQGIVWPALEGEGAAEGEAEAAAAGAVSFRGGDDDGEEAAGGGGDVSWSRGADGSVVVDEGGMLVRPVDPDRPKKGMSSFFFFSVRALRGVQAPSAFSYVNRLSMVLVYGRAGRLNRQKRRFPARADRQAQGPRDGQGGGGGPAGRDGGAPTFGWREYSQIPRVPDQLGAPSV
jgi:hypothetical protein